MRRIHRYPQKSTRHLTCITRNCQGYILPLAVFSLLTFFAFLACAFDVMRQFYCVQQLRFAARSAALDVMPFACIDAAGNPQNSPLCIASGVLGPETHARLVRALNRTGGPNTTEANTAPSGDPRDNTRPSQVPVQIEESDIRASANETEDASELILRVTARRTGDDSLHMMFLPAIFALNSLTGGSVPAEARSRDQTGIVEVIGQPATRIGPACPSDSSGQRNEAAYRGRLAVFPVALEYADFVAALPATTAPPSTVTIRVVDPGTSPPLKSAPYLRSYFINNARGNSVSNYYSHCGSASSMDELIGLFKYFDRNVSPAVPQATRLPAAVESGVTIDRFSSGRTSFDNPDLRTILEDIRQTATNKCFVLPVVDRSDGTAPAALSTVRGFAFLKLLSLSELSPGLWQFVFEINESVVTLNASCSGGLRGIPSTAERMPAPPTSGPFHMRKLLPGTNILESRSRGIVLAPAVSPRSIFRDEER